MWEEWNFGIGENKPTKDFTVDEKNGQGVAFKNKYSKKDSKCGGYRSIW
jgi:hypothetical protein